MIQIRDLSFSYGSTTILKSVSCDIEDGDFCAVLGHNGSGKSTLLKCIAGILPTQAAVALQGKDIERLPARERAKIVSYVPQRQDVVFDFTVFDTVMMGRNPYQSRWENASADDTGIVTDVLEKTNLIALKDRMLTQLSGGEMQRTSIARAMAQQTPLMLLDEPLANLDIAHKYEIMDILQQLNSQRNTTILIILHDFSFAKKYTNKTLLLKSGSLLHFDATERVLTDAIIRPAFSLSSDYQIDTNGNINRL